MLVKKWPILDIRTGHSCQSEDLEKPQHGMFSVCDTLARTGSVNSSYREPQVVCHLLSCCVHTFITSKSDSKVLEFSDKFQRCAVEEVGIAELPLLKKTMTFVLSVFSLSPLKSA